MSEEKMLKEITRLLRLLAKNPDTLKDIAKRLLFLAKTGVLPPRVFKATPTKDYKLEEIRKVIRWKKFDLSRSLSADYLVEKGVIDIKEGDGDDKGDCPKSLAVFLSADKGNITVQVQGADEKANYNVNMELMATTGKTDDIIFLSKSLDKGSVTEPLGLLDGVPYFYGIAITDNANGCVFCLNDIDKGWLVSKDGEAITLNDVNVQSCEQLAEALGGGK